MNFGDYSDYCVVIEQISTQIEGRISGDTLFGKFSWVFLETYGEDEFQKFLEEHRVSAVILFSGIFPEGHVPMPVFLPSLKEYEAQNEKEYETLKTLKKLQYVRFDDIYRLFSEEGFKPDIMNLSVFSKSSQRIHVAISRINGTALNGMIFTTSESRNNSDLWLFLRVKKGFLRKFDIEKILRLAFETGVGAKKSSGKGHYRVKKISETDVLIPKGNENAFLSLSRWIPEGKDPSAGHYRVYSKRPKIGGIFSEIGIFQKKPLLMLEEGSWFYTSGLKPYYGRVVENVQLPIYQLSKNLIQSCYCLPLYFEAPPEGD